MELGTDKTSHASTRLTLTKYAPYVAACNLVNVLVIVVGSLKHQHFDVISFWAMMTAIFFGYLLANSLRNLEPAEPKHRLSKLQIEQNNRRFIGKTFFAAFPWAFISVFLILFPNGENVNLAYAIAAGMASVCCMLLSTNRHAAYTYLLTIMFPTLIALFIKADSAHYYSMGLLGMTQLIFLAGAVNFISTTVENHMKTALDLDFSKSKIKETSEEIDRISQLDSLTGLYNRPTLFRILEARLAGRPKKEAKRFAFFNINIDGFARIDQALGPVVADEVIAMAARRIKNVFDDNDVAARLYGVDFGVFIENVETVDGVRAFTKGLERELSGPYMVGDKELSLVFNIGAVTGQDVKVNAEQLLNVSRKSREKARRSENSQHCVFDLDALVRERMKQTAAA